jgi:hypothetical protein
MEVTTEEHATDDENSVLIVHVVLKNIGYRSLMPGKRGLEVSVKRMPTPEPFKSLNWSEGQLVLDEKDILGVYKDDPQDDYGDGVYRLDRHGSYHETCALSISRGTVYLVQVALWLADDDLQIEYCFHASPGKSESAGRLTTPPTAEE